MSPKHYVIKSVFEAIWLSQIPRLLRRFSTSRGIIFTLHRVVPGAPADFSPNSLLQITPDFLEFAITQIRKLGYETVSMDEAVRRIKSPNPEGRFVVFSFDDAYRDNLVYALPILRRHNCPFILYVPTAFVDGIGEVWWQALEDILAQQDAIAVPDEKGDIAYIETKTVSQKNAAFTELYWALRRMPNPRRIDVIREMGTRYRFDISEHCRSLIMDWAELKRVESDPLCTIGAHTVHHYELAKIPVEQAEAEMKLSADVLEAQFGRRPRHLSYPIGAKVSADEREFALAAKLGFVTGVTTRPGAIYRSHADKLHALPRISLNGHFQSSRYLEVFAAGDIFTAAGRLLG